MMTGYSDMLAHVQHSGGQGRWPIPPFWQGWLWLRYARYQVIEAVHVSHLL